MTSFSLLIISSTYTTYSKGLPKRFPSEVLSLIDFNYEHKKIYQVGFAILKIKRFSTMSILANVL